MKKTEIIKRLRDELDDNAEYFTTVLYGEANQIIGVEVHIMENEN